jgi:hypothetical protein
MGDIKLTEEIGKLRGGDTKIGLRRISPDIRHISPILATQSIPGAEGDVKSCSTDEDIEFVLRSVFSYDFCLCDFSDRSEVHFALFFMDDTFQIAVSGCWPLV